MIATTLKSVLVAITLVASAVARTVPVIPLPAQQTLQSTTPQHEKIDAMPHERQKVPGDNSAYYSGPTSRNEQLFEIEEFDIAPNPPVLDHRFFGFLGGFMPDNVPDLNETSLRLSMQKDGDVLNQIEDKFADCQWIFMRHQRFDYSHELKPGRMEFIMDYIFFGRGVDPGNYTFAAEAKLPDGRVLFSFEFTLPLNKED